MAVIGDLGGVGRALLVATSLVIAGCGGSQADDSTTTTTTVERDDGGAPDLEESRSKVTRMAALYAILGDSVDNAGSDCDAVAAAIDDWSKRNRPEVTRLNGELAALPADQVKQLSAGLESTLRRAALQVKDGNDRCPGHQGVFDAISNLPR